MRCNVVISRSAERWRARTRERGGGCPNESLAIAHPRGKCAFLPRVRAGVRGGRVARKVDLPLCTPRRAFAIAKPLLPLGAGYHMGLSALRRTIIAAEAFMLQEARQLRIPRVSRYALSSCVAAALLAGCGGSQSPIGAPGAMSQHGDQRLRRKRLPAAAMSPFIASRDILMAIEPEAGLVALNGVLYGTTWKGGTVGIQRPERTVSGRFLA